jgi:Phage tail tube protein
MSEPSNGNNSTILFAREGTGTSAGARWGDVPTTPIPHKLLVLTGGGMVGDVAFIDNQLLGSDPNPRDVRSGKQSASGQFTFYPNIKSGAWLTEFILGVRAVATGAGPYVSISKLQSGRLPSWSIEESFDLATPEYKITTGARVDKVTIPFAAEGFLEYQTTLLAKGVTLGTTPMTGSPVDWAEDACFDHLEMSKLKIGGADFLQAMTGSIDISHNHFGDHYVAMGGGMRRSLPRRRAKVSGKVKTFFEDMTLYSLALAGTYTTLEIEWTNGVELINFLLPRVRFKRTDPKIVDGPTDVEFAFEASKDVTDATSVMATITGEVIEAGLAV